MAAAVTVAAALLAFPLAYYMARYASPPLKAALYLAVIMPLWSSYLVRDLRLEADPGQRGHPDLVLRRGWG